MTQKALENVTDGLQVNSPWRAGAGLRHL